MALTLPEHAAFERRWRRVQRVGRVVVVVLLLAAVAGIFGTGPLSHATASAPGGSYSVDYDRFLRTTQTSQLTISATPSHRSSQIAIDAGYTSSTQISDVVPEPDSETAAGGRIVLSYQDSRPAQVAIDVLPQTIGVHRATIWVDGIRTRLEQVTWP